MMPFLNFGIYLGLRGEIGMQKKSKAMINNSNNNSMKQIKRIGTKQTIMLLISPSSMARELRKVENHLKS